MQNQNPLYQTKPKKQVAKGQLIKDLTRPLLSFFSEIYYFIKSCTMHGGIV